MEVHKNCDGCYDYRHNKCSCSDWNDDGKCPCVVCIVKAMCSSNTCDNWTFWRDGMRRVRWDETDGHK